MSELEQHSNIEREYPGYRKGFAKRLESGFTSSHSNHNDRLKEISGYQIQKAIALGLPELSARERDLLQYYAAFLNIPALQKGKTSVWPSNRLTCQLLGISEAGLRRYKGSLEHKGYLYRRYNHRNGPMEQGAIDLAPLLYQVEGLLVSIEKVFSEQRQYYEKQGEERNETGSAGLSAHPLKNEHQKQEDSNFSLTVPEKQNEEENETVPTGLIDIIRLSPQLAAHIDVDETSPLWDQLNQAVKFLLPEHNIVSHSWTRARQRYGWRAVELLVVCLEDPSIQDGSRFLAYMAHQWQGEMNLKSNLKRISDAIAIRDKQVAQDKEVAVLKKRMPLLEKAGIAESEIGSWFRQAEITETEDQLVVTVPNSFIASRVRENYSVLLQNACLKPAHIEQYVDRK